MKFLLTSDQLYFFQQNGYIEFEQFLTEKQLEIINLAIQEALSPSLTKASSEEQFMGGRDLCHRNQSLFKWACQNHFAHIMSDLIQTRPLRFGFDQWFSSVQESSNLRLKKTTEHYQSFLDQKASLESVSCVKGVAGGLMICLSSGSGDREKDDPFPFHKESVLFMSPSTVWNWNSIRQHPGQNFYMIVYTELSAWYQFQPADPHTHEWKRLGYVFNEKLADQRHPIVYR